MARPAHSIDTFNSNSSEMKTRDTKRLGSVVKITCKRDMMRFATTGFINNWPTVLITNGQWWHIKKHKEVSQNNNNNYYSMAITQVNLH